MMCACVRASVLCVACERVVNLPLARMRMRACARVCSPAVLRAPPGPGPRHSREPVRQAAMEQTQARYCATIIVVMMQLSHWRKRIV